MMCPLPDKAPIAEVRVLDWFHRGQYQHLFVPNFLCPLPSQSQIIFSELRILLKQPIQLSVQGMHVDLFLLSDRVCTLSRSRSLFPLDKVNSALEIDSNIAPISLCPTSLRSAVGLSHWMMLAAGCCWLPLAAENQRH